jgi:hypothetical protein
VDENKRDAAFADIMKTINTECNISYYQGDAPLQALQKGVTNGWELHTNMVSDYWFPEKVWLSK